MKTWKEKRKRTALILSASQINTKRRCLRAWWFEKVKRLPTPVISGGVFGSVLHAVCERYLLADDLGRDFQGSPVDLYPKGWEISWDKYSKKEEGRLSPTEQDTVKKLIAKAIEQGVLERLPQRQVEKQFNFVINKPEIPSGGNCTVSIVGFIDVLMPGEIQDHKTSKDKRYFLSKASLKVNCQMLIYAYYEIKRIKEQGGSVPKTIKLRHNQYCKDPKRPSIRKTEVEVKTVDVLAHWKQVEADAEEMVILRDSTEEFHDIPDPEDPQKACRAYGGCPFLTICFGRESPEVYEERMTKYLNHDTQTKESTIMPNPFAAKLAKTSAVNPPLQAVTIPITPEIVKPVVPPVAPPVEEVITLDVIASWPVQKAPWAQENTSGFNVQGQPNQIDDELSKQAGGYTSDMFVVYAPIDGMVPIMGKSVMPGATIRARCPMTLAAPATVVETPAREIPETTAEESEAFVEQALAESEAKRIAIEPTELNDNETGFVENIADTTGKLSEPLEEPEDKYVPRLTGQKKRVRKNAKSFMLMLGITSSYGYFKKGSGRYVYDAFQVFEDIKNQIAQDNGVETFEDLDVWKRRDMIRSKGAVIADAFSSDIVQVATTVVSPDMQAFIDAIRPYAGNVFCGINC